MQLWYFFINFTFNSTTHTSHLKNRERKKRRKKTLTIDKTTSKTWMLLQFSRFWICSIKAVLNTKALWDKHITVYSCKTTFIVIYGFFPHWKNPSGHCSQWWSIHHKPNNVKSPFLACIIFIMQYVERRKKQNKWFYEGNMRSVFHWGETTETLWTRARFLITKAIIITLNEPNYSH